MYLLCNKSHVIQYKNGFPRGRNVDLASLVYTEHNINYVCAIEDALTKRLQLRTINELNKRQTLTIKNLTSLCIVAANEWLPAGYPTISNIVVN